MSKINLKWYCWRKIHCKVYCY